MQRFFEAALGLPKVTHEASESREWAILPQRSRDELVLSAVHSRLDRALFFLQRDVGYILLDDAQPQRGGGVQLRNPGQEDDKGRRVTHIPQRKPRVEDPELRQTIRFNTTTAKYAQYPEDLVLVWRFTDLLARANPAFTELVKQESLYKTALQGIRLMHLCYYNYSDLALTLAYASVYFKRVCQIVGHQMSDTEAAHVCVLLIFLAHSFVIDETCPLVYWQTYIFRTYATLKVLDAALFRVFQMLDFKLRISKWDEKYALSVLLCSDNGHDIILSIKEGKVFHDGKDSCD